MVGLNNRPVCHLKPSCRAGCVVIKEQRRLETTMEELFTAEELDRARRIYCKYKSKPPYFRQQKVGEEIVKPKINQINDYTGYSNFPECWAYALEQYFKLGAVQGEEGIADGLKLRARQFDKLATTAAME